MGEDPFMVGRIWEKMFAATYGREPSTRGWSEYGAISAMAPVDAALYDIMAKSTGLPLYKFLGGYRDSVPVYVTGGYYREGKGIPELIEEIRGYVGQGFNAIKLKVGGISGGYSVEDDYNRVKAVREGVGPAVRLMLDANNGWDVETTIRASNKMYDLDITWLEEPLHWYDDVDPLKQVKLNTRIPLASGEHEVTRWGARRLMETGAIDVMQFDANAHAGITEWRKIAGMAAMCHIRMAPHHEPGAACPPVGFDTERLYPGILRQPRPRPLLVRNLRPETAHRKEHPVLGRYTRPGCRVQPESARAVRDEGRLVPSITSKPRIFWGAGSHLSQAWDPIHERSYEGHEKIGAVLFRWCVTVFITARG